MSEPLLTEKQLWLLRCIDKHCETADASSAFDVYEKPEKSTHPGADEILAEFEYGEFQDLVSGLRKQQCIDASFSGGVKTVSISPEGRSYICSSDRPDLVDAREQAARRHPVWASAILVHRISQPFVAWIALGLSIVATCSTCSRSESVNLQGVQNERMDEWQNNPPLPSATSE